MSRSWTCRTVAALALGLCAALASASPLSNALPAMRSALTARAAAAGIPAREASRLSAANASLGTVDGDFDAADVKGLVGAAKNLVASKTADATVLGAAGDLAQCLIDECEAREVAIVPVLAKLYPSATKAKVQAAIDKARVVVADAKAKVATDPAAVIAGLTKVLAKYATNQAKIDAVVAALTASNPFQHPAGQGGDQFFNVSARTVTITKVVCDVQVVPATSPGFRLAGDVSSFVNAQFALPHVVTPGQFIRTSQMSGTVLRAVLDAVNRKYGGNEFARYSGWVRLSLKGGGVVVFAIYT